MERRSFMIGASAFMTAMGVAPRAVLSQACLLTPKFPDPRLPDIAMITFMPQYSPNGLVIIFNPGVVRHVGPYLSAFFEAHEYGHACLNHVAAHVFIQASDPFTRSWMSQRMELEADAFATQVMLQARNIRAVQQAIVWFYGQMHNPHGMLLSTHPPGPARAQNIRHVAAQMGVQL